MSKKRIQNYVFLPGTASSSNAYPNAYTLLVNNKSFIQKEANTYINDSITTDTAINLNPNAVGLLTSNKEFLKKEIRAYIAARVAASTGPFAGFTYDADKCERDVGYIIDAYIYDLRYGGNEQIRYVAEQYWLGGTPQVDGTRQAEIWAHTKLRDIITKYVFTRTVYPTEQVAGVIQTTSGSDAETHMIQRLSTLSEILLDVITNGLSVLETTNLYPNASSGQTLDRNFTGTLANSINNQLDTISTRNFHDTLDNIDTGKVRIGLAFDCFQYNDFITTFWCGFGLARGTDNFIALQFGHLCGPLTSSTADRKD